MQVQDFTVIRISPIVYNDRDIRDDSYSDAAPDRATKTHKQQRQQQTTAAHA